MDRLNQEEKEWLLMKELEMRRCSRRGHEVQTWDVFRFLKIINKLRRHD